MHAGGKRWQVPGGKIPSILRGSVGTENKKKGQVCAWPFFLPETDHRALVFMNRFSGELVHGVVFSAGFQSRFTSKVFFVVVTNVRT